jgi:DNA-binding transcriptional ArsR family regulator
MTNPSTPPGTLADRFGRVTERRPAVEAEAKALASEIRLRILRVCLDEPRTNHEIAERLGVNPGTTLHHVRKLVKTGFLAPQQVRRGTRGAREIPYLATGKTWWLGPPDTATSAGYTRTNAMVDAFLQEFSRVPEPDQALMYRAGLWLTDSEHDKLGRRVQALLEEYMGRPRTADARPYSLFTVVHPDVGRQVTPPPTG